jgi:hypothetical protein
MLTGENFYPERSENGGNNRAALPTRKIRRKKDFDPWLREVVEYVPVIEIQAVIEPSD